MIDTEIIRLREQAEFWSASAWQEIRGPLIRGFFNALCFIASSVFYFLGNWPTLALILVAVGALCVCEWLYCIRVAVRICRFHQRTFHRWPWQH